MEDLLKVLEFAKQKLETVGDDIPTYDDDSEADHGDGQYCGRVHAYKEVIRFCGKELSQIK